MGIRLIILPYKDDDNLLLFPGCWQALCIMYGLGSMLFSVQAKGPVRRET